MKIMITFSCFSALSFCCLYPLVADATVTSDVGIIEGTEEPFESKLPMTAAVVSGSEFVADVESSVVFVL